MKRLTALAAAGIMSMLGSTLVHALPIAAGSFTLDASETINPVQIFDIDATGYTNLTLAFSAIGAGTIDPCRVHFIRDCLAISTDGLTVISDLSVTTQWQYFEPLGLQIDDSAFDLIFSARITGADESMSINWDVSGDMFQNLRVLVVSEPGILTLVTFGLLGFGATRRRSA